MSDDSEKPRRVGYKSPPVQHQFKKGQSGNPRGRPPRAVRALVPRQFRKDVISVCEKQTRVRTPDGEQSVSILEAVLLRMAHQAMTGHGPSMRFLIEHYREAIEGHYMENHESFAFLEMVERGDIERPVPPENESFHRKFMNDLRKRTRRFLK